MLNKQPQALAAAYKRAVFKLSKVAELKLHSEMTDEQIDELVKALAEAKATREGKDWKTLVKGQRWFVEDLIRSSTMSVEELLDHEYQSAFPDVASEDEMLLSLELLAAKLHA